MKHSAPDTIISDEVHEEIERMASAMVEFAKSLQQVWEVIREFVIAAWHGLILELAVFCETDAGWDERVARSRMKRLDHEERLAIVSRNKWRLVLDPFV